jgi:hypothetical protein
VKEYLLGKIWNDFSFIRITRRVAERPRNIAAIQIISRAFPLFFIMLGGRIN